MTILDESIWKELTSTQIYDGPILYNAVLEMKAKSVLELGTGWYHSATFFLSALAQTDGKMVTVDIGRHNGVYGKVKEYWEKFSIQGERLKERYAEGGDLNYDPSKEDFITFPVDILFIDTSHAYQHTLEELRKFVPYVSSIGRVYFHDVNACVEVEQAAKEFIKEDTSWIYSNITDKRSQYGIGVLIRK